MILDNIRNYRLYLGAHSGFEKAFEFINSYLSDKKPIGKYEIDGDKIYASVQSYDTADEKEKLYEGHRKYIDIQFVVSGKESMWWNDVKKLSPQMEYDSNKDFISFDDNSDEGTKVNLCDGCFAILFPEDGHKPGCTWDHKCTVNKIVIKVKI